LIKIDEPSGCISGRYPPTEWARLAITDIGTHAERPQAAGIVYTGDWFSTSQTGGMA
jgi:hypothetical protein